MPKAPDETSPKDSPREHEGAGQGRDASPGDQARAFERWQKDVLAPALAKTPEREKSFSTVSDAEVPRIATPIE